ncbi:hypothetical protein [Cytophaga aurantiaca]|uniref:hypothetical protein n=1 Tax=Cytophaga aurantiaca TaxID=29530 RepID=UPI0012FB8BAF|nr:hypothetical protein [Cytophaga aurantiaca]
MGYIFKVFKIMNHCIRIRCFFLIVLNSTGFIFYGNAQSVTIKKCDTITVPRDPSFNSHCNKKSYFAPDLDWFILKHQRRRTEDNHYDNLECSNAAKSYRVWSKSLGFVLDFKVTSLGKKKGKIPLAYMNMDSSLAGTPFKDRMVGKALILDKKMVKKVFYLIDSLGLDSIFFVQQGYTGDKIDPNSKWGLPVADKNYNHTFFIYEYATPTEYYLQMYPECNCNDLPCMTWINKLAIFEYRLLIMFQPYMQAIMQMDDALYEKKLFRLSGTL